MNIDTRARRAADGVRASTGGIDPMAQITELRNEDKTRRRTTSALAGIGAVVLLAGTGWFLASQLGGDNGTAPPASVPSPTVSAVSLGPGQTVGTRLQPTLEAKAPASWQVSADRRFVWLDSDGAPWGASIQMGGPVEKVWDYDRNEPIRVSIGGCFWPLSCSYANYLLGHPSLELLEERVVTVDGRQFDQLTFKVKDDAPSTPGYGGVILGQFDGIDSGQPWDEVEQGTVFTVTAIELAPGRADNDTMVVKSSGAETEAEQAELAAALDLLLSTMKLPN